MDNRHLTKAPNSFWTIWFPLTLTVIAFVALLILVPIFESNGSLDAAKWAQISTILLIVPIILGGVILLLLLIFLVLALSKFRPWVSNTLLKTSKVMVNINKYSKTFCRILVTPFHWISKAINAIEHFGKKVFIF
jgi:hypothetical protein